MVKLIGEEWAPASMPGLASLTTIRQPCIVCGHPTGDCTTDFHMELSKMAEAAAAKSEPVKDAQAAQLDKHNTAPPSESLEVADRAPKGRVIRAGDAVTVESSDAESDKIVIVKEDVWQEVFPENSLRPSYVLLYHAGQAVAQSKLDRNSEISKAAPRP